MSTQIKRLYQNSKEFVPITLAEAVVVNTAKIPGLQNLEITTLEKVLKATLTLIGLNATDIDTLQNAVNNINTALKNKQDSLTAGAGITISSTGVISATGGGFQYKIVKSLPTASADCENTVYLVATNNVEGNIFTEYLCIESNSKYIWEQIGTVSSDVNLDNYVTKAEFYSVGITAQDVKTSAGVSVEVDYDIPNTLYDE